MAALTMDIATNTAAVSCGPSGTDVTISVTAPAGSRVVAGGFQTDAATGDVTLAASSPDGTDLNVWNIALRITPPSTTTVSVTAYATYVKVG